MIQNTDKTKTPVYTGKLFRDFERQFTCLTNTCSNLLPIFPGALTAMLMALLSVAKPVELIDVQVSEFKNHQKAQIDYALYFLLHTLPCQRTPLI
ncbi:MAG: hypothetical protein ACI8R8_002310 [Paraglaciecola sp.]